jgi:hypothetical protein
MVAAANVVEVVALVGNTARATMLAALMGGQVDADVNRACDRVRRNRRPFASME